MDKFEELQAIVEWFTDKDIPDVLSKSNERFSVDVLIYNPITDENTIGWFDYLKEQWLFLCNEKNKNFNWRYINPKIDKNVRETRKQRKNA